jgi:UDP-N-acetylmuramoylalanine--D-glutamate ligase
VAVIHAISMDDAVEQARRIAKSGDIVLLSPACASFDMFSGYAERGDKFAQAVLNGVTA